MICLIAATKKDAEKWAKSQNLRFDEWFWPASVYELYVKKGGFHTILVNDNIESITNDQLNRLLTTAWDVGGRK